MLIPITIRSKAGIKRDGTMFEGDYYVDGQWVRFQRGLPRKMGGYRQISNNATGIVRQFYTQALNNFVYTHIGYADGVGSFTIDSNGNTSATTDRTPAGYVGSSNITWQFDAVRDAAGSDTVIVASPTSTLEDISDATTFPIYIGGIYDSDPLIPLIDTAATPSPLPVTTNGGGIVALHPYLFVFGANGYIRWSDANDPNNFTTGDAGDAYISSSKIIKGLPLRGGAQAPAGIFWTLDSLIRASYTGGQDVFSFDTVTASSSVLAVNSIIEYDGIYFWIGLDRFLMYNGVVKEVPNDLNINHFFDGLNQNHVHKIFAYKVPRFGEIWWCYPRGDSTECNHAIIYNLRENTWYDTALPNGGRSAGIYAQVFQSPILSGVDTVPVPPADYRITEAGDARITEAGDLRITDSGATAYKIWRHEYGTDEIDGTFINSIRSNFETGDISMLIADQPKNRAVRCDMIEPDFVQTGDMTVQIIGRMNARSPEIYSEIRTFPAVASTPEQQPVFFKEQRRELRFRFESNTVGGSYQMGQVIGHIELGDGRFQS